MREREGQRKKVSEKEKERESAIPPECKYSLQTRPGVNKYAVIQ